MENQENDEFSIPKNFMLRCIKCGWGRTTTGLPSDLSDLVYVKSSCKGCGKFKRYRCPKCNTACPMKKVKS